MGRCFVEVQNHAVAEQTVEPAFIFRTVLDSWTASVTNWRKGIPRSAATDFAREKRKRKLGISSVALTSHIAIFMIYGNEGSVAIIRSRCRLLRSKDSCFVTESNRIVPQAMIHLKVKPDPRTRIGLNFFPVVTVSLHSRAVLRRKGEGDTAAAGIASVEGSAVDSSGGIHNYADVRVCARGAAELEHFAEGECVSALAR